MHIKKKMQHKSNLLFALSGKWKGNIYFDEKKDNSY